MFYQWVVIAQPELARVTREALGYRLAGIGAGIGLALLGSLIHDAFAGQRERH
jgi:hypothetical protein